MKKIFGLPAILLPISLLAVGAFIGNSALDIKMNGTYYNNSTNLLQIKFGLPVLISWVFHIVLWYIKRPPKRWAWLQVCISIVCLFIAYFSLAFPMPRRYYDYETGWTTNFFRINSTLLFLPVLTFYITQIAFWVYGLMELVKSHQPKEDDIIT